MLQLPTYPKTKIRSELTTLMTVVNWGDILELSYCFLF